MKLFNRILAMVMALLLCCMPALAETAGADDVMATVNGDVVTRAEYETYLVSLQDYYASAGYDVTDETIAALLCQFAMATAVEYRLMDQKVVELGLALTDEDKAAAEEAARADWAAVIEDGMTYYGITAESTEDERAAVLVTILAELEGMGYTEETYVEESVMFAGYDKLQAEIIKDVTVSAEEVQAYYDSLVEADKVAYGSDAAAYESALQMNELYAMYGMTDYVTELYYKPEGYRTVTHILLEVDEALLKTYTDLQASYEEQQLALEEGTEVTGELVTEEQIELARQAILTAVQPTVDEINALMANGATFAELIPQYSTDPGMTTEDAIAAGYEVHMDSVNWVIEFRDAAFTVDNIGDVTAPVVTDYGVHILQYTGDVPGGAVEMTEEMYNEFYATLLTNAQSEAYSAAVAQWMEEAEIVYSDEAAVFMGEAAAEETADDASTELVDETAETPAE